MESPLPLETQYGFQPGFLLIQLKTFPAQGWHHQLQLRRGFVAIMNIVALIGLTALFAIFAATMAGAEALLRRNTAARVTAETPRKRKRRAF